MGLACRSMDLDDWQTIFTAQVRGLQNIHPQAHRTLINWAAWSHDIGKVPGLTNHLYPPSFWQQYEPDKDPEPWGEIDEDELTRHTESLSDSLRALVRPEPKEKAGYDGKAGEATDILIHHTDFPSCWRRIVKTVYYWRGLEYRYPQDCRMDPDAFLFQFGRVLTYVEGR